uniref:Uncharacterized protein n=1 Tax=Rhizophora mucronata TaxID=61149 RepID=A0A2P2NVI8_RHIMU
MQFGRGIKAKETNSFGF